MLGGNKKITLSFIPKIEASALDKGIKSLQTNFNKISFKGLNKDSAAVKDINKTLTTLGTKTKGVFSAFANKRLDSGGYAALNKQIAETVTLQKEAKKAIEAAMKADLDAYLAVHPKKVLRLKTIKDEIAAIKERRKEIIKAADVEIAKINLRKAAAPENIGTYESQVSTAKATIKNEASTSTEVEDAQVELEIANKLLVVRREIQADLDVQHKIKREITASSKENLEILNKETAKINQGGKTAAQLKEQETLLKKIDADYDEIAKNSDKMAKSSSTNTASLKNMQIAAKNSAPVFTKISDTFSNMGEKIVALLSFRAIISILQKAKESVTGLDEKLTEIATVTNKTRDALWETFSTFNTMAKQLGVTTKEVVNASVIFYRQGLKTAEVMELVRASTISAAIANIDTAEASSRLTAALNGFNLAATEASYVADQFAGLAAKSASSFNELSYALSKTAASANVAGIDIEHMLGFLAKTIETTREAPENIGTAFKTIIARLQQLKTVGKTVDDGISLNKAETALNAVGVALTDSTGQFRDLDGVFDDLGGKWDDLDRNTKAYLATILAGSRQQSRFLALMNDYERTTELVGIAQNSAGEAATQFATHLTGIEVALNRLKATQEEFYTSLLSADSLKYLYKGLEVLLQLLTDIGPIVSVAIGIAVLFTLKVSLLTASMAKSALANVAAASSLDYYNKVMEQSTGLFGKVTSWILKLVTTRESETVATTTAAAAHAAYQAILFGVIIAIVAIVAVIAILLKAEQRQIDKAQALVDTTRTELGVLQRKEDQIVSLTEAYEELYKVEAKSLAQAEAYVATTQELANLFPDLIRGYDDLGNAQFNINELKERELELLAETIVKSKEALAADIALSKETLDEKYGDVQDTKGAVTSAAGSLKVSLIDGDTEAEVEHYEKRLREAAEKSQKAENDYEKAVTEYAGTLKTQMRGLSKEIISEYSKINGEVSDIEASFLNNFVSVSSSQFSLDIAKTASKNLSPKETQALAQDFSDSFETMTKTLLENLSKNDSVAEAYADAYSFDPDETVAEFESDMASFRGQVKGLDLGAGLADELIEKAITNQNLDSLYELYDINEKLDDSMEKLKAKINETMSGFVLADEGVAEGSVKAFKEAIRSELTYITLDDTDFDNLTASAVGAFSDSLADFSNADTAKINEAFGKLIFAGRGDENKISDLMDSLFVSGNQNEAFNIMDELAEKAGISSTEMYFLKSQFIGIDTIDLSNFIDQTNDMADSISAISTAQKELAETGTLSIEQLEALGVAGVAFSISSDGVISILESESSLIAKNYASQKKEIEDVIEQKKKLVKTNEEALASNIAYAYSLEPKGFEDRDLEGLSDDYIEALANIESMTEEQERLNAETEYYEDLLNKISKIDLKGLATKSAAELSASLVAQADAKIDALKTLQDDIDENGGFDFAAKNALIDAFPEIYGSIQELENGMFTVSTHVLEKYKNELANATIGSYTATIDGLKVELEKLKVDKYLLSGDELETADERIETITTQILHLTIASKQVGKYVNDGIVEALDTVEEFNTSLALTYENLNKISQLEFKISMLDGLRALASTDSTDSKAELETARSLNAKKVVLIKELIAARRAEVDSSKEELINQAKVLGKHKEYLYVEDGIVQRRLDLIETLGPELQEEIESEINLYDELSESYQGNMSEMIAATQMLLDMAKTQQSAQIELENEVLTIIKEQQAAIHEAAMEVFDAKIAALEKEIELIDEIYAKKKAQEEADEKELELQKKIDRYNLISRDNSGTYLQEKMTLEEEIAELREEIADDLLVAELDNQKEGLQSKIDATEEEQTLADEEFNRKLDTLEGYWEKVHDITKLGENEVLDFLVSNSSEYKAASELQKEAMLDGWEDIVKDTNLLVIDASTTIGKLIDEYEALIITLGKVSVAMDDVNAKEYTDPNLTDDGDAIQDGDPNKHGVVWNAAITEPDYDNTIRGFTDLVANISPDVPLDLSLNDGVNASKNEDLDKAISNALTALSNANVSSSTAYSSITRAKTSGEVSDILEKYLPQFEDGGPVAFTGLAMLHGTKNNPERVLNVAETAQLDEMFRLLNSIVTDDSKSYGDVGNSDTQFVNNIVIQVDDSVDENSAHSIGEQIGSGIEEFFKQNLRNSPNKLSIVKGT